MILGFLVFVSWIFFVIVVVVGLFVFFFLPAEF